MESSLFRERYADHILFSALRIRKGDVLSINTEEEDYSFARLIAQKAKKVTGNGSYIQILKNGRITDEFDILSDFPLTKKPTLFLYLSYFREKDEVENGRIYEARELQRYSLLSDPLDNPLPSFPFVTGFLPSDGWNEKLKELDEEKTSEELLGSLVEADDEESTRRQENLVYQTKELNEMGLSEGRITSDNGTDLTFSFLPRSSFFSSYMSTQDGRLFSPYMVSCDIFRLLDPASLEGWLNTTRSFMLWGKNVKNLSLHFSKGKVDSVNGSSYVRSLFSLYTSQDENASRASMLTFSESGNPLYDEELTYITEFDRMRTVSITLGGPKGEAVNEETAGRTVDSLLSLSLPIGDESLTAVCLDRNGNERTVFSDGSIITDDED